MMIEFHSQWYQMGMLNIFFSFILWPGMLLVEAFFYWRVRTRNVYRRQSWAHVFLFAFFLSAPFMRDFLFWLYDNFGINMDISTYTNIVDVSLGITAWGAFLTGHVLFVRVLVLCSRKRPALAEAGDGVNLLDDVLY
jgi:hypothetical protein